MTQLKIKDGKINFKCKAEHCEHCCCGPFEGITKELCNIDRRPFDEIVLTPEDYQKIYDNGYSDLMEEGYSQEMNKSYHRMVLEPDGTCTAWKNGKCLIHDFSPTLCRAFPFYFDMFSGLCAINCEGFSDENWTEIEDYKYALDAAKKMYEFWLDFYSESEPSEK